MEISWDNERICIHVTCLMIYVVIKCLCKGGLVMSETQPTTLKDNGVNDYYC